MTASQTHTSETDHIPERINIIESAIALRDSSNIRYLVLLLIRSPFCIEKVLFRICWFWPYAAEKPCQKAVKVLILTLKGTCLPCNPLIQAWNWNVPCLLLLLRASQNYCYCCVLISDLPELLLLIDIFSIDQLCLIQYYSWSFSWEKSRFGGHLISQMKNGLHFYEAGMQATAHHNSFWHKKCGKKLQREWYGRVWLCRRWRNGSRQWYSLVMIKVERVRLLVVQLLSPHASEHKNSVGSQKIKVDSA